MSSDETTKKASKNSKRSNLSEKSQHWAKTGRSVLNGIIGDYLDQENSPLAIQMGLYHQGRRLNLDEEIARQIDHPLTNKVVVLVHGLTNLETVWDYPRYTDTTQGEKDESQSAIETENYGTKLQNDFSYTPLFLRYNTGLSVKRNGRELSNILAQLSVIYPIKIDELILIGFSMGGLLCREAQRNAFESNESWLEALSKCIYIGSPHEGSPLEKFGYLTGEVFRQLPKEYLSHWADVIDVRSEGIKDLRHGLKKRHSGSSEGPCQSFVSNARHYFISGGVFDPSFSFLNRFIGDSLVRKSSARPSSAPEDSASAHFEGMAHIPLAHSENVYQQIRQWIAQEKSEDEDKLKLNVFSSNINVDQVVNEAESPSSELINGTIDLLVSGFNSAVKTVETIHYSVSDEHFANTKRMPVISQFAYPIEQIHKGVSGTVFFSLRFGGRMAHKLTKEAFSRVEKN